MTGGNNGRGGQQQGGTTGGGDNNGNRAMMGQQADRDTMMGHQGSGRFFASFE